MLAAPEAAKAGSGWAGGQKGGTIPRERRKRGDLVTTTLVACADGQARGVFSLVSCALPGQLGCGQLPGRRMRLTGGGMFADGQGAEVSPPRHEQSTRCPAGPPAGPAYSADGLVHMSDSERMTD